MSLDERADFLGFKATSEYQWLKQIHSSCCCAAGLASCKHPKESPRQPGLKAGKYIETCKALYQRLQKWSWKTIYCLWNSSNFSKSLGGHWKTPALSWHVISLLWARGVQYGTTRYTQAQLLIFLDFSNNSPYVQRYDGSNVHLSYSCITSQPWINNSCSCETGRQVLLHSADGDCKTERLNVSTVSEEALCARANIQMLFAYVMSHKSSLNSI